VTRRDRTLEEALAAAEALRKLGFSADDIYLGNDMDGGQVGVILRTQGREFIITCGRWYGSEEQLAEEWRLKVEKWNSATTPTSWRERIWRRSFVARNATALCVKLVEKGFNVDEQSQAKN
jgi:hypothetical protein